MQITDKVLLVLIPILIAWLIALSTQVRQYEKALANRVEEEVARQLAKKDKDRLDFFANPVIEAYKKTGRPYNEPESIEDVFKMIDDFVK